MTTQLNIQMADAFDGFLLAKRAKGLSASTIYLYEWTLGYWDQRWGKMTLGDVTAGHVRTWLIWLQGKDDFPAPKSDRGVLLSSRSVHAHFRNLAAFWSWCVREDLIVRSPMANVETPGFTEKIPDCLTEDEMKYLLRKVRGNGDRNAFRDYCIHLFFLATGVRLAELAGLSLNDVDLRNGYARVLGKGRKERIVSLGEILPMELKRYMLKYRDAPDEKALFVNERGVRFGRGGIQEMIEKDLKKIIPRKLTKTGPHTLRHTWFTLRLRETRDLKGTSLAGGHSDTRVTERYTHLALNDFTRGEDGRAYSPVDSILRKNGNGRKGNTLQKFDANRAPTGAH